MKQQINLYQVEKEEVAFQFNFYHMVWVGGIFFIMLLLVTTYDVIEYFLVKRELKVLTKEQLMKTEKLQAVSGQIPAEKTRNEIIAEVKKYELEKQSKQEILSLLTFVQTKRLIKFSGYLSALAKESMPGIWLTHINFKENGEYIALEGKTINAQYVPKLIAKLSDESAFVGKTFQLFKISLDEKTNQLNFILETKSYQKNE